jgi:hypothetical protein
MKEYFNKLIDGSGTIPIAWPFLPVFCLIGLFLGWITRNLLNQWWGIRYDPALSLMYSIPLVGVVLLISVGILICVRSKKKMWFFLICTPPLSFIMGFAFYFAPYF